MTFLESTSLVTLFDLGNILMTPGAVGAMKDAGQLPSEFLSRHSSGDWGNLEYRDSRSNDIAVGRDLRILSSYATTKGENLWVITEHDRSLTTILLPEEY